ncbi:cysteine dioxygenase type 1-like [Apostichopus japonicus]|uniref:cysteine dioxygenase type 1-like n=1 Tax=Stichopus japonicus TaxID=307972 RepID=UPI003AB227F1
MSKTYVKCPSSLEELIASLHILFEEDNVNIEEVQEVMENYKSNVDDWGKFAIYDNHRYTRNLVDEGNGKFNLMLLCWGESQGSSIHSHSDAHCFMKMLDGTLTETLYHWPEKASKKRPMEQFAANDYHENQVAYICDEKGLHRVENKSHTETACSLHLYSPPFDTCKCFDQRTGKTFSTKVTFWSRFGKRTPFNVNGCQSACITAEGD